LGRLGLVSAPDDWRRYVAPAAFLLAVTIAVVLIRSGIESSTDASRSGQPTVPVTTHKVVVTTAATTTTKRPTAAGKRFWTVKAGDTFGVISSQSGVPIATIEQLNPNASSTSLFIGEKIRLK
jgi:LysM repeat protein